MKLETSKQQKLKVLGWGHSQTSVLGPVLRTEAVSNLVPILNLDSITITIHIP